MSSLVRLGTPARIVTKSSHLNGVLASQCAFRKRDFSNSSTLNKQNILLEDHSSGLGFIRSNPRPPKPRLHGVTEVRGPYYSAYGTRHLEDLIETMGYHIDGLKFAGGSF